MITMTPEQFEKIDLLDKLFAAMSIGQLTELVESERIVAILKGMDNNPSILKRLIQEHDNQMMEVINLKGEVSSLNYDVQSLARLILKPFDPSSSNAAQSLKSKFSLY